MEDIRPTRIGQNYIQRKLGIAEQIPTESIARIISKILREVRVFLRQFWQMNYLSMLKN